MRVGEKKADWHRGILNMNCAMDRRPTKLTIAGWAGLFASIGGSRSETALTLLT
jgi:hypothetical protein